MHLVSTISYTYDDSENVQPAHCIEKSIFPFKFICFNVQYDGAGFIRFHRFSGYLSTCLLSVCSLQIAIEIPLTKLRCGLATFQIGRERIEKKILMRNKYFPSTASMYSTTES